MKIRTSYMQAVNRSTYWFIMTHNSLTSKDN